MHLLLFSTIKIGTKSTQKAIKHVSLKSKVQVVIGQSTICCLIQLLKKQESVGRQKKLDQGTLIYLR